MDPITFDSQMEINMATQSQLKKMKIKRIGKYIKSTSYSTHVNKSMFQYKQNENAHFAQKIKNNQEDRKKIKIKIKRIRANKNIEAFAEILVKNQPKNQKFNLKIVKNQQNSIFFNYFSAKDMNICIKCREPITEINKYNQNQQIQNNKQTNYQEKCQQVNYQIQGYRIIVNTVDDVKDLTQQQSQKQPQKLIEEKSIDKQLEKQQKQVKQLENQISIFFPKKQEQRISATSVTLHNSPNHLGLCCDAGSDYIYSQSSQCSSYQNEKGNTNKKQYKLKQNNQFQRKKKQINKSKPHKQIRSHPFLNSMLKRKSSYQKPTGNQSPRLQNEASKKENNQKQYKKIYQNQNITKKSNKNLQRSERSSVATQDRNLKKIVTRKQSSLSQQQQTIYQVKNNKYIVNKNVSSKTNSNLQKGRNSRTTNSSYNTLQLNEIVQKSRQQVSVNKAKNIR